MIDQKLIDTIVNEIYNRLKQRDDLPRLLLIGTVGVEEQKMLQSTYQMTYPIDKEEDYAAILISELSVERMAHLGLGCSYDEEERCILKALLEEKPVYLLENGLVYKRYKKTAYKPLYTLYQDYENKLRQYGIRMIKHVGELLTEGKNEPILEYTKEVDLKSKKLLLETDLMNRHLEAFTMIEIGAKCIVTPLAEDYIRSHKLKIKRV